ncbi:methyltransferase family protein [Dongia deserti]|uniref:methyltransferase family protein n=1 Tax=Dongia deserti TaxID=2268030 RepID=UPI000E65334E|nr:isoprenylcysteine carboxylmethyltransferase family protein [Dongia deserti]
MVEARTALRGTAWVFYAIFVLEILFMISPAALHFYALYGPALRFLGQHPETAWLTQFFLPHISTTASPVLNLLGPAGWLLLALGTLFFLASALPLYWAKIRRRGEVTGGLYRHIRHPQYVGLAIMGFGVLLIWPRFLVLVSLIVMLGLYRVLAGWEESQCLARFGEHYKDYMARTGRFVPHALQRWLPRVLPAAGPGRVVAGLAVFIATLALSIAAAFGLRNYSLSQVAAVYQTNFAILSPAQLTEQELEAARRTAMDNEAVRAALDNAPAGKRLIYVIPADWYLPDLPVEAQPAPGSVHHGSASFDRTHFKLLFANIRSHEPAPSGQDIVRAAYGLDPIIVARIDLAAGRVTAVERPPAHVRWGDIPTPTF